MRPFPTLVLALALLAASIPASSSREHLAGASSDGGIALQADPDALLWDALRSTGHTPAEWAVLLTSDADTNGRTDFLDLLVTMAVPAGQADVPVELLVYGDPAALDAIAEAVPDAERIAPIGALFVTVPLFELPLLEVPGVSLVVWEPRAHVFASSNPAGGSPANMPQNFIHQADPAWTNTPTAYDGSDVTIAILDTGVDAAHQALNGGKVSQWKDCTSSAGTPYDDHNPGHGTHVASIAAGDDGTDYRGLAYKADIAGVKILDGSGSGTISWFTCGVYWIYYNPQIDVASMSAGLAVPPLGITTLNGGELDIFGWDGVANTLPIYGDVPFTVAAGNWIGTGVDVIGLDETMHAGVNGVNQVSSPGFASDVITVGAVDRYQAPATFTALGPGKFAAIKPDVAAQGQETWGALKGTTSRYEQWAGTSMATPIAAGAVAMMIQKNDALAAGDYADALRSGAGPACLVATSSFGCSFGLTEPTDPNFVAGHGVVKAWNSLALVP